MTIEAVLFDADGVVQYQKTQWRDAFECVLGVGRAHQVHDFMKDVFAAEQPALVGQAEFPEALAAILKQWKCKGSVDDALRIWTMIEVYTDVVDAIQELRRSGVRCCLASNQQSHRARHMSGILKYCELFDREFYSCELGISKPDNEYFLRVIEELKASSPRAVVFLDDREANVAAARIAGLHAAKYEGSAGSQALWETLSAFGITRPRLSLGRSAT